MICFFKQKTAYEMRISDWSSDVCSSDLHSLQTYAVSAPISGIIIEKNANVGDVTGDRALFVIADPTKLHAEFFVYPRDAERIRVGQKVAVRSLSGEARLSAEVEAILPTADLASQTLMAHVHMPASAAQQ